MGLFGSRRTPTDINSYTHGTEPPNSFCEITFARGAKLHIVHTASESGPARLTSLRLSNRRDENILVITERFRDLRSLDRALPYLQAVANAQIPTASELIRNLLTTF